ncbi:protein obstructor-E-like [Tachypleus tridentatus]|uniref:protein obstructor-E-like n=1 Tax=Tachypleus tridentatus TaxID=6853 RepID=UPI003FD51FC1
MEIIQAGLLLVLSGPCLGQLSRDFSCPQDYGLFPHGEYCDYYYECIDGVATTRLCPNGLVFSGRRRGVLKNCDYPINVGCPDGNRVMGQSPISRGHCKWLWGRFSHNTSCTRFWECWNGTATSHRCPFSLLYNNELEACDWPSNVEGCQKHPICRKVPDGRIPISSSCFIYWYCNKGYPQLQRCPAGLAFYSETLSCELAQNVPGCEPSTTTPAPQEDENIRGLNYIQPDPQPQSYHQPGLVSIDEQPNTEDF